MYNLERPDDGKYWIICLETIKWWEGNGVLEEEKIVTVGYIGIASDGNGSLCGGG